MGVRLKDSLRCTEINPEDANAARYLTTIRQRMQQLGLSPSFQRKSGSSKGQLTPMSSIPPEHSVLQTSVPAIADTQPAPSGTTSLNCTPALLWQLEDALYQLSRECSCCLALSAAKLVNSSLTKFLPTDALAPCMK